MLTSEFLIGNPMTQVIRPTGRPSTPNRPAGGPLPAPSRPAAPSVAPATAPPVNTAGSHSHAAGNPDYERLASEHKQLGLSRARLSVLHEQAAERVKACEAEAAKLGLGSLEELQARIQATQAKDQQALADFEAQLKSERELQETVAHRLNELGNGS